MKADSTPADSSSSSKAPFEAHHPVIMGIDPGSQLAGYCVLSSKKPRPLMPRDFSVIDAGVLRPRAQLNLAERIARLHEATYELILQHQPSVCVLEKAFSGKNVATAIKLGEIRGAFITAAGRARVPLEEITPAQVKKLITGNGRAEKEEVSLTLKAIMGFDRGNMPHDVSDALAISLSHGLQLASQTA